MALKVLMDKTPQAIAAVNIGLKEAVTAACNGLQADIQTSIRTGPRTGRIYYRKGRTHQASAPGEPPAEDYGDLAESVNVDLSRIGVLTGEVRVDDEAGEHLEYGAPAANLAPRPFFGPATERMEQVFPAIAEEKCKSKLGAI